MIEWPSRSRCGDPGIGLAHRVAEAADRGGVLHATRRLDAGGDVNGPGPQLLNPGNDVCGMQPTRQNEPMSNAGGNERPIECLSSAAEALDVSVEQQGLGPAMAAREV